MFLRFFSAVLLTLTLAACSDHSPVAPDSQTQLADHHNEDEDHDEDHAEDLDAHDPDHKIENVFGLQDTKDYRILPHRIGPYWFGAFLHRAPSPYLIPTESSEIFVVAYLRAELPRRRGGPPARAPQPQYFYVIPTKANKRVLHKLHKLMDDKKFLLLTLDPNPQKFYFKFANQDLNFATTDETVLTKDDDGQLRLSFPTTVAQE